jgi:hypothetical protein
MVLLVVRKLNSRDAGPLRTGLLLLPHGIDMLTIQPTAQACNILCCACSSSGITGN